MPRIIKSKYLILKILWGIAFLGGIAGATYYLINTLTTYYQYQPVVQVSLIEEFPTQFPAVTICNLNPFVNLNRSGINQTNLFNKVSLNSKNINYYFVEAQENLKRIVANFSIDQQQLIGFQLNNETLISCSFNKAICDSTYFTSYFNYNYGNCYTFNGGDIENTMSTTLTGSDYGLTLEILTGDPTIQISTNIKSGLLLVVHNQTQTLVPSIELTNGIFIPTGYDSYVSVSRELRSKLSVPYSNCITDLTASQSFGSVLNNYMIESNITTYDQPSCIRLCYQTVVQNLCECYDPKYPPLGNMKIKCLNFYQVECTLNVTDNIFLNGNDYLNSCGFDCPIACNTVDYSLSTSMSSYPSQFYVQALVDKNYLSNFDTANRNLLSDVRSYLVKVTVNYNQLGYSYIQEQESLDVFSIVGNVGGQFGLFLGLSVLSFIETFELLLDIIIYSRKR